jgi:hypothetical protein
MSLVLYVPVVKYLKKKLRKHSLVIATKNKIKYLRRCHFHSYSYEMCFFCVSSYKELTAAPLLCAYPYKADSQAYV